MSEAAMEALRKLESDLTYYRGVLKLSIDQAADLEIVRAALREAPVVGQRIEGWAGMTRPPWGWEFATDDGRFTPGPQSQRATLIIHEPPAPSSGSETI